jgi:acetate---CoA ligase (ADP-forming)
MSKPEINLVENSGKVILKDGSTMVFRPIRKEDAPVWLDFYRRLSISQESLRLLHFPTRMSIEDAIHYCTVDYTSQFAVVAETREGQEKHIIAEGRYIQKTDRKIAEISIVVLNYYQQKGIGTKLIEWLAIAARKQGIEFFETQVLTNNTALLSVFQSYGFLMEQRQENDVYYIKFPLTRTPQVEEKKYERTAIATNKSLQYILKPRSVAVVGASNRAGALGRLVLQSMLQSGFKGSVYPINANHDHILSVKAYPSVLDVSDDIDLAIIAAPSMQILSIVDECGRKKVKGLIVIADGFREKDEKGALLEKEMVDIAFSYGMRIIGPNCMGVINTDPNVKLNATFASVDPVPGNISFVSQSGAVGLGVLEYANKMDIGLANYVSIGNRSDIASTDLLLYWEKDPATKVILLYLESYDNPETFVRVSRRISSKKPILAIKGGNTPEGSKATRSHTGAMATSNLVSEALLREAGIVAVNSINELFESAILMANQPIPKGRNVAVISSGGGPGILAADACARNGLKLPELSNNTLIRIKSVIKRDINIGNPIDLTASVTPEEFERVLNILAEDKQYDSIITIYIPPAGLDNSAIENAIGRVAPVTRQKGKPILACFVGTTLAKGKMMGDNFIPYYLFPEEAVQALAKAVKYNEIKTQTTGSMPEYPDIERDKARQLINRISTNNTENSLWISSQDICEIFKCYGINFVENSIADSPEKAIEIAEKVGYPVAVKLNSATITHKTDVGGVVLNVNNRDDIRKAFVTIKNNLTKKGRENEMQGITIQRQITDGLEVIVGVTRDTQLGHLVMFGMGGVLAELLQDTALRFLPLTDIKVRELINSAKLSQLLKGYRGMAAYDVRSLEDLLLRISLLVEDFPQIKEMDLNPVKLQTDCHGYWIVDGRILVS